MHYTAYVENLFDAIKQQALEHQAKKIVFVRIQIGRDEGIDLEHFREHVEILKSSSAIKYAFLEYELVDGKGIFLRDVEMEV